MTKEVRDNFDGMTYDEDETQEFSFVNRHDPRGFVRVAGDISTANFLRLFGEMVKKPKYERWVKKSKDKDGNEIEGHWEKLAGQ
jgi:hypothetical protein